MALRYNPNGNFYTFDSNYKDPSNDILPTNEKINELLDSLSLTHDSLKSELYNYEIIALLKIDNGEYIYVVEELEDTSDIVDVHYYLKYVSNGNVILDWEIDTYNPYFGVSVSYINYDSVDRIIEIHYSEKHYVCKVKIAIPNGNKKHNNYWICKCNAYSRKQSPEYKDQEIAEVIEFIKNDKIMIGKSYFK